MQTDSTSRCDIDETDDPPPSVPAEPRPQRLKPRPPSDYDPFKQIVHDVFDTDNHDIRDPDDLDLECQYVRDTFRKQHDRLREQRGLPSYVEPAMETLQSAMKAAANAAAAAAVEKVAAVAAVTAAEATPAVAPTAVPDDRYVTLQQMATLVQKSKKTLENRISRKENPLPDPDIQGAGGKASEWRWSRVRGWLMEEFQRPLPEKCPDLCLGWR